MLHGVTDLSPCFLPTSHLFETPTCWELEILPWSCNCPVERRWWEKCQSQSEIGFFVHFVLQLIISLFSIHLWIFLVTEKSILFLSLSGTSAWSTSFLLLQLLKLEFTWIDWPQLVWQARDRPATVGKVSFLPKNIFWLLLNSSLPHLGRPVVHTVPNHP